MAKSLFIGFDFSINKPAATCLYDKKFYFMIWPREMDEKKVQKYNDAGVFVHERGLDAVTTDKKNSQLVLEHTIRSTELANCILEDLDRFINEVIKIDKDTPIYVVSEGLSYGSKGDATLNLATYKGVLLAKLYEHYKGQLYGLYTYSPITIKSVAGCAGKNKQGKDSMIKAFVNECIDVPFKTALVNGDLLNKTNFIPCVDDIVDSYWAVKTLIKKEGFA